MPQTRNPSPSRGNQPGNTPDTPDNAGQNGDASNATTEESKADRFRRIAGKRTADALKAIEKVGATSRSTTYEYNDEQVDKIVTALRDKVDATEKSLKGHGGGGTFVL